MVPNPQDAVKGHLKVTGVTGQQSDGIRPALPVQAAHLQVPRTLG